MKRPKRTGNSPVKHIPEIITSNDIYSVPDIND